MAAKFGFFVDEDHSNLPTLHWLPKIHKRPYNDLACDYETDLAIMKHAITGVKRVCDV